MFNTMFVYWSLNNQVMKDTFCIWESKLVHKRALFCPLSQCNAYAYPAQWNFLITIGWYDKLNFGSDVFLSFRRFLMFTVPGEWKCRRPELWKYAQTVFVSMSPSQHVQLYTSFKPTFYLKLSSPHVAVEIHEHADAHHFNQTGKSALNYLWIQCDELEEKWKKEDLSISSYFTELELPNNV